MSRSPSARPASSLSRPAADPGHTRCGGGVSGRARPQTQAGRADGVDGRSTAESKVRREAGPSRIVRRWDNETAKQPHRASAPSANPKHLAPAPRDARAGRSWRLEAHKDCPGSPPIRGSACGAMGAGGQAGELTIVFVALRSHGVCGRVPSHLSSLHSRGPRLPGDERSRRRRRRAVPASRLPGSRRARGCVHATGITQRVNAESRTYTADL